jgi:glycosyltransferase involved in cell wall biosynthesis
MKINRLAILATHPIQYQAPLFKELSKYENIKLTVLFYSDYSAKKFNDKEFNREINWNANILDGYENKVIGVLNNSKEIGFNNPSVKNLDNILNKKNYDIVLIQGWNHWANIKAIFAAKKNGLKIMMRSEATDHFENKKSIRRIIREIVLKIIFKKIDYFIAIGENNKNFYLKRNIENKNIGFAPYSVDNKLFEIKNKNNEGNVIKDKLKLSNSKKIILFASKLTERKHLDDLLKAYIKLEKPKPYLLIVGSGEKAEETRSYITENKLDDVKLYGFKDQNEIKEFYTIADIFILPSIKETWGLVVNEAMCANCAIIVSDQVGSAKDLVVEGKNGYIYKARNIEELSNSIRRCLQNENYIKYGNYSRVLIKKYNIDKTAEGIVKAINELKY